MSRIIILFLLTGLLTLTNSSAKGQSIKYLYDNAGNRTVRQVVNASFAQKSAKTDADTIRSDRDIMNTSIDELHIKIYPNPTHSDLQINFKGDIRNNNISYSISNSVGHVVLSGSINSNSSNTIPTSCLRPGAYILLFIAPDKSSKTFKVIKQ